MRIWLILIKSSIEEICENVTQGHSSHSPALFFLMHILIIFQRFYLFSEREGKEKERDRIINVWLLLTCPPTGDLAHNPGMCPRLGIEQVTL